MFLKRLELVGFKSFAPRTTVDFSPGIIVVVGPNGSGKTNIAEAVRWVLGEQSAKAVRARKAEEVIFAGSAARQPLGMAEVSLVLDNADGLLPIEFADVRLTRRLYRSGESEYLLNGGRARLRDITQQLLHAGLGPDTYTVIGQGSVDELILQRPDERRIAFENAADIRRHQLKLTDTRAKLVTTESNLQRVQDILAELAPHVRRLKGQTDRAARAEAQRLELRDLRRRLYRLRLTQVRTAARHAESELEQATRTVERAERERACVEQALADVERALAALEDQLVALRPRAQAYDGQVRAAEQGFAVTRERVAGLTEQQRAADAELERLSQRLPALQREADSLSLAEPELEPSADSEAALAHARAQVRAAERDLASAQSERASVARERDQAERRAAEAETRLFRAGEQLRALEAAAAVDQARHTERQARIQVLEQRVADLRLESARAAQNAQHACSNRETASRARADAERRLEAARERLRAESQHADRLHGLLVALGATEPTGPVAAGLPETWQTALDGLPVVGVAPEVAARIRPIDRLLWGYLGRVVVLANALSAREAHRRLSTALRDAPAWGVLSLDGLLLTPGGERAIESVDSGSALADWRQQVEHATAELRAAEEARQAAQLEQAAARAALEGADDAERAARAALSAVEAELVQLRRADSATAAELAQLHAEQAHSTQRTDDHQHVSLRVEVARADLTQARQQRDTSITRLAALDEQVAALLSDVNRLRSEASVLETAHLKVHAEYQARTALRTRTRAELESIELDRQAILQRKAVLGAQLNQLAEHEQQLVEEHRIAVNALAPIEHELHRAEARRVDLLAQRRSLAQQLGELRAAERAAQQVHEDQHVRAQRAADELERLNAEIIEAAELDGGIGEQLSLDPDHELVEPFEPSFDPEAARRRIAVLQRELRALGGLAESVVAEYRQLSERHDFLLDQSQDLRAAVAELHAAAQELEATMRERFAEVMRATGEAFQECFGVLFGGGEARLVLTEPNDLLRTGVDIVARPPGKKLQGLLSLSGGERALTIVALLFGLLKVHPTPFCVLDEVDAALDEANVQRFVRLLAEFSRQIQFIVVTHNRATMEIADAMFGVSMDTQGVSRIFSVKPRAVATASHDSVPLVQARYEHP